VQLGSARAGTQIQLPAAEIIRSAVGLLAVILVLNFRRRRHQWARPALGGQALAWPEGRGPPWPLLWLHLDMSNNTLPDFACAVFHTHGGCPEKR
jgi:hypothetical protein